MSTRTFWLRLGALATGYLVLGRLSTTYTTLGATSSFSLMTGMAYWALLTGGMSLWPAIAVGSVVGSLTLGRPVDTALIFAVGNTVPPVVAAWIGQRSWSSPDDVCTLRGMLEFICYVALGTTALGAVIGTSGMVMGGLVPADQFWRSALSWWTGNVAGVMVVVPLLLSWFNWTRGERVAAVWEIAFTLCVLGLVMVLVLGRQAGGTIYEVFAFLNLPMLVWLSIRGSPRLAVTSLVVCALVSVIAARGGFGPFGARPVADRAWMLDVFIGVSGVSTLLMVAVARERRGTEERLRRFFALNPVAHASWDEQGLITDANAAFLTLSGYTAGDVAARQVTWAGLTPPDDSDVRLRNLATLERDGQHRPLEIRLRRKDGRTVPILVASAMWQRDSAGGFSALLDLTEQTAAAEQRHLLERQLQHSHRLESLGTLAGGIAHDFNNILTAILANAELIRVTGPANKNDHAAQITLAAQRAREVVRQIMTFSRQEHAVREPMDLAPLVEEAVALLRVSFPANIVIRTAIDAQRRLVNAHGGQVLQLIMNLGTNALHAMRERGGQLDITVGVASAMPDGDPPGERVCIRVADTGVGMEESTLQRIFDPFFTTKSPGEGTGLGLAVVHGIVEAHGGTIHASSTPGAGSTFTISLPVVSVAAPADIAAVRVATPAAPRRVLVVDDEPAVLAATERLLRSAGYAVEATTEPWLALSRLRQSPDAWDVLLTDFMMPGMLGTDLAVACRTHAPDLAVVIMTGNQAALGGGIREGSYHVVLPKPFTVDELDTSLRRAVDRLRDTRQSELRSTA